MAFTTLFLLQCQGFFFSSLSQIHSQDHNDAAAGRPVLLLCGLAMPAAALGRSAAALRGHCFGFLVFWYHKECAGPEEVISGVPGIACVPFLAQRREEISKS